MSAEATKYRWYLCVETKPANWSCSEQAAEPVIVADSKPTQIAIPVATSWPKWWDALQVSHELRPLVSFTSQGANATVPAKQSS